MVLGALAACVIALAAYVLTTNMVKDRQAKLETVTAKTETATQRANQLKPYADFQAMAETRIQTVKDLASSRFDWEQAMRDISRTIPANVTLTSLNGTISSGAGAAARPPEPAAPACVPRSPHPGHRAQRLHAQPRGRGDAVAPSNVDGVTRAFLGKSLASAERDRQQAYYCHDDHDHDRVPGKRLPTFDVVIFFEGSEVPPTVADVTVQPSAPAVNSRRRKARTAVQPPASQRNRRSRRTTPPVAAPPAPPVPQEAVPSDLHEQDPARLRGWVGLAVGAFYFLALAPQREEIAKLDTDVAAKEAELTQAQQMLAGYEQARKTLQVELHDAREARQGRACR